MTETTAQHEIWKKKPNETTFIEVIKSLFILLFFLLNLACLPKSEQKQQKNEAE